ncbi:hypothetical protein WMO21_00605 [Lachnospiraceae bacterium CLA-AA-H58]|uniref:hypothetical protein n=1 Tax=Pilosibacter fragilis TaxID=3078042 RepID=UPI0032D49EC6
MNALKRGLIYILAFFTILQCYSLLSLIVPNRYFYLLIDFVLLILLLYEKKINANNNIFMIIIAYWLSLSLLFSNGYFRNMEFLFSVFLPFPLFLLFSCNRRNVLEYMAAYANIMFALSAISLFFFTFGSILKIIQPTGFYPYTEIEWGRNDYFDYYHVYCEGQTVYALGYSGIRNIALFVEGPMLTYTLSFALYYELFFREQGARKLYLIVMVATIITSFSTTGLLIVIALLYLRFYRVLKNNKFFKYLLQPIILFMLAYVGIYILKDKFASNVFSASARTDDILSSFKCFFDNMLMGVGYQNIDGISPYRLFNRANAGVSTGIGAIVAYGGVLWGIWHIVPFIIGIISYIPNPKQRTQTGFIIMASALLLVTVVQSRILCTIINSISWSFILKNANFKNNMKILRS